MEVYIPKARSQAEYEKEQRKREHVSGTTLTHGTLVGFILQREDNKHENRACDELGEELVDFGQEGLRISAKDSCRRSGARWNGPNASSFDAIYG